MLSAMSSVLPAPSVLPLALPAGESMQQLIARLASTDVELKPKGSHLSASALGGTAIKKLRIVILGFGTARQKLVLE
jgi:hypothetical protein